MTLALAAGWLLSAAAPARAQTDTPPALTVTSPVQNASGRPDVRVTGQCVDDAPNCTIRVFGGVPSELLAVAVDSIDAVIAPPEGQTILFFQATDSAGQTAEVTRTVFIVSSTRLAPEAAFPGRILAIDAARALVVDETVSPRVVRLVDRGTNASQVIWTGSTASEVITSGYLAPNGGALFTTQSGMPPFSVATLREWRGGALGTVGDISPTTLVVKNTFALFIEFPCCSAERLVLRDLTTGVNSIVSTTAGEEYHDVTPDGRAIFWTVPPPYEVHEFTPAPPATTPLTAAAPLSSFRTVADGVNVLFLRSTSTPGGFSLMLRKAGGVEEVLAPELDSTFVPRRDYHAVGGWIAFMRTSNVGVLTLVVRAPDGAERQIVPSGFHPQIETMNGHGDVVYSVIPPDGLVRSRYLARADGSVADLGVLSGTALFTNSEWFVAAGSTLFAVRDNVTERSILAEGATGTFFSTDIAILNPGSEPVTATIRYLRENLPEIQETRDLPARSRTTIHTDDIPGLEGTAVSTHVDAPDGAKLVVERLMTWDDRGYGGHLGNAVSTPRLRWMFAEGAQGFFSTFFLIANSAATPATVRFTFLVELGTPVTHTMTVPAASRKTFHAGDLAGLVNRSFATIVESDVPVVAERAMYFGTSPFWLGGHGSAGVPQPSTSWFHAEGATGSLFDTYILLANPHAEAVTVNVVYTTDSGLFVLRPKTLPPLSRLTINIEDEAPELANVAVSTEIHSSLAIVAERAMYWGTTGDGWREAHNSFGVTTAGSKWGVAEGRAGGIRGYQTYVLVSNALSEPAELKVTFIREDGAAFERSYSVGPRQRFNINAGGDVPELADSNFSTIVEALGMAQITVESAIYWNVGGVIWEGGGNTLATLLQ